MLGLKARIRRKRKYSSYHGTVGKRVGNIIQRQFEAEKPMEKCYTDITEFSIPTSNQKLYLSPILDGYNSETYSLFPFVFTKFRPIKRYVKNKTF